MKGRAYLKGLGVGLVVVAVAHVVPWSAVAILAVLLGVAAGVYPGSAIARGESAGIEWAAALAFAAFAVLGVDVSPWWLCVGWVLHAAWDQAHHAFLRRTRPSESYADICLTFDLLVAGYIALITAGG